MKTSSVITYAEMIADSNLEMEFAIKDQGDLICSIKSNKESTTYELPHISESTDEEKYVVLTTAVLSMLVRVVGKNKIAELLDAEIHDDLE